MSTPSTENYVLGRGMLFWDPWDSSTSSYTGERALGNAPEVSFNMNATFLDHFSSMSGFKSKDKTIVNEVSPMVTFTLDELHSDNWQMLVFGQKTETVQAVSDGALTTAIAYPMKDRYFDLDRRYIQTKILTHGTVTNGPFVAGTTITGGTSGATADIIQVLSATQLIVKSVNGTFVAAETITASTVSAGLTVVPAWVPGLAVVYLTATPTTFYNANTDYIIDAKTGRIKITAGSDIADGVSITVAYGCEAKTYQVIKALNAIGAEGKLRYVSDNPEGGQWEIEMWKVRMKPAGDTALIGDDWATLGFEGDILRDAEYHADSPYMTMKVDDPA